MAQITLSQLFPSAQVGENGILKSLGEDFALCENGNMVFHWADFNETCEMIVKQLELDPALRADFKLREEAISRLELIPCWIRTSNKVFQMTMYSLYEKYISGQTSLFADVDPFGPTEISFISSTGPFRQMAITECFSPITYRDFVLVYLIKGKLPKRDYRIRLKAKVLAEYGENFTNARLINFEQMTAGGLLFSVESDFFVNELSRSENIRILIDTTILQKGHGKSFADLQTLLGNHTFNLMYSSHKEDAFICKISDFSTQNSFDFFRNRKVFLFLSYDKLATSRPEAVKDFKKFIEYSREMIRNHYTEVFKKVQSA